MAEKKYVIFKLDNGEYGLDIKTVQEIIEVEEITILPQSLDLIEGVINLRGRVIPVIDLKKKFYGTATLTDVSRPAIIVDIGEQSVGIITDDVTEVLSVNDDCVENLQGFMKQSTNSGVIGMGKLNERLLIFLDIAQVFSGTEKEQLLLQQ